MKAKAIRLRLQALVSDEIDPHTGEFLGEVLDCLELNSRNYDVCLTLALEEMRRVRDNVAAAMAALEAELARTGLEAAGGDKQCHES